MNTRRKPVSASLSLERRLAAYALVGGTALVGSRDVAEASIVTGTVNQPVNGSAGVNLDLDNDTINEFVFSTTSGINSTNSFTLMVGSGAALQGSGTLMSGNVAKPLATVLPGGTQIGSVAPGTSTWTSATPGNGSKSVLGLQDYDSTTGLPVATGAWAGETQKFVGVAFVLSAGASGPVPYPFHYGWIRLSAPSTWPGSLTVVDWAYETRAGVPILAGATTGGTVPEPGTLQVVALGAVGLIAWRRRRLQDGRS